MHVGAVRDPAVPQPRLDRFQAATAAPGRAVAESPVVLPARRLTRPRDPSPASTDAAARRSAFKRCWRRAGWLHDVRSKK